MTSICFQGNDCMVGIKNGQLFITAIQQCCHGNTVDQVTIWLPAELEEKLRQVEDFDDDAGSTRFHLN